MSVKHSIRWQFTLYGTIALVLCFLAMGLPAVSNPTPANATPANATPASAEPNPGVCAPKTSYGVLANGQLRKITSGTPSEIVNHGSADIGKSFPLTTGYLGYDPAWARKVQVNGLGAAPGGQAFYAFRGWAKGYYDQNNVWHEGVRNNFDLF